MKGRFHKKSKSIPLNVQTTWMMLNYRHQAQKSKPALCNTLKWRSPNFASKKATSRIQTPCKEEGDGHVLPKEMPEDYDTPSDEQIDNDRVMPQNCQWTRNLNGRNEKALNVLRQNSEKPKIKSVCLRRPETFSYFIGNSKRSQYQSILRLTRCSPSKVSLSQVQDRTFSERTSSRQTCSELYKRTVDQH